MADQSLYSIGNGPSRLARHPFAPGTTMRCIVCGRIEAANFHENQWRCLEIDGVPHYACPREFPPDGSTRAEFARAYRTVIEAVMRRG